VAFWDVGNSTGESILNKLTFGSGLFGPRLCSGKENCSSLV